MNIAGKKFLGIQEKLFQCNLEGNKIASRFCELSIMQHFLYIQQHNHGLTGTSTLRRLASMCSPSNVIFFSITA